MNTDLIVGIIAASAVIAGAVITTPRIVRDPLHSIQKQLDVYRLLPDSSPAKQAMLRRVEQQVARLATEDTARRNPGGVVLAFLFWLLAGAAAWFAWGAGVWGWPLWVLAALLLLFGLVGFAQSITKVPRAENGQTIEYQNSRRARIEQKARKRE
jgi:Flp pilus assembly protein TadB